MKKILTTPWENKEDKKYFVAGNHFLSLPEIDCEGNVKSINFLRSDTRSLVEFSGEPLILPEISDGKKVDLCGAQCRYENDFIFTLEKECESVSISAKIFSPEYIVGAVYSMKLVAKKDATFQVGLKANAKCGSKIIFHKKEIKKSIEAEHYAWTDTLIYSMEGLGGFGIASSEKCEITKSSGRICTEFALKQGESKEVFFYISVGTESDGIGLHAMDMKRRGGEKLLADQKRILDSRHVDIENDSLEPMANLNMNFSYYYSIGYTLDKMELVLVTSKSPRYYVSAAFWARDCFLWAFPAIMRANKKLAREILLEGFQKYLKNGANHALYIDGSVLYPGFELDQLVAPIIALKSYVEYTFDEGIFNEKLVQDGIDYILTSLEKWNSKNGLFATELDPSDDPVENSFLAYDNALVEVALRFVKSDSAEHLKKDIMDKFTHFKDGVKIFSYDFENGKQRVYDNPPGSLLLLPYYGFIDKNEDIMKNTAEYLFSDKNEYFVREGNLFGLSCDHVKYPWIKSIINYILSFGAEDKFIKVLENVTLDNMIASESFDPTTGESKTGEAFATMAGFLAHGIFYAYNK